MSYQYRVFLSRTVITTRFFYKQHFYKQRNTETGKNQANAKQHPEVELLEIIHILHPSYHPKIGPILKHKQKASMSVLMRLCD